MGGWVVWVGRKVAVRAPVNHTVTQMAMEAEHHACGGVVWVPERHASVKVWVPERRASVKPTEGLEDCVGPLRCPRAKALR